MKRIISILQIIMPVAALGLLIAQLVVSNQLATLNARMGSLDTAVYEARDTNAVLETAVASASSLMAIRERAYAQGFLEPASSQVLTLSPQIPVALSIPADHPAEAPAH